MEFLRLRLEAVLRASLIGVLGLGLAACGGGGGDSGPSNFVSNSSSSAAAGSSSSSSSSSIAVAPAWVQGTYAPSSSFAAQCAVRRIGIDPSGSAYPDRQGSVTLENFWLRSYTHELYLWYSEVQDRDPAVYSTAESYFDTQKTMAKTSSGAYRDRFHFTYDTAEWEALSQSGVVGGYGVEWAFISPTPPRVLKVMMVEPVSPAATAGLLRGGQVTAIDNVSIDITSQAGVDALNAGLSPKLDETHSFTIRDVSGVSRTVSMKATNVTLTPVQNVKTIDTLSGKVGYMLFNDHIATAEQQLVNAFKTLQQANVTDLVMDLRYNGGGYLAIASEVAYMIAGSAATNGKVFERTAFNDQYPANVNPVTGGTNSPIPFLTTGLGLSSPKGTVLPVLNLSRVFVLTGSGTCSASESIINGLRGVGVNVIQIGSTTCGKPYGFYPEDNCGTTYFSVQMKGVNEVGFGDYSDGFAPAVPPVSVGGDKLPGCVVADDLNHALGDPAENRLAQALYYHRFGSCSAAISVADKRPQQSLTFDDGTGIAINTPSRPWRENRILALPSTP